MLQIGIAHSQKHTVIKENLATWFNSGAANVYATPSMIALMESTAMLSVADYLPKDSITVGVSVSIKHIKACTVGANVLCNTTLTKIDNKILTFYVEVLLGDEKIGYGYHDRAIVDYDRFMKKL